MKAITGKVTELINDFVRDGCVNNEECSERASVLFLEYRKWAEAKGAPIRYIATSTMFGRAMSSRFEWKHTVTGRIYFGIGLK